MMMMMKLPILPCAEKLELVLSTAPKPDITPTKTVKTEKVPLAEVVSPRCLWYEIYGGKDLPKR